MGWLWITLTVICLVVIIYGVLETKTFVWISGAIGAIVFITCYFAIPVHGYMEVSSVHWFWTVDIYEFKPCKHYDTTGRCSSQWRAEQAAENAIPRGAYNIHIDVTRRSETVTDRTWTDNNGHHHEETHTEYYYYGEYTYTIDEWEKSGEANAVGNDKNPHEPERPYPTTAPDILGEHKCGAGHTEEYSVTGYVDGELHTYWLNKSDWEKINENDEFGYSKFRFGDKIWGLEIAQ